MNFNYNQVTQRSIIKKAICRAAVCMAYEAFEEERRANSRNRKSHIRPFLKLRKLFGDYYTSIPQMIVDDSDFYFSTFRMTHDTFLELLNILGPFLQKNSKREPISPMERLHVTLMYLVSGDAQKSVARNFRIGTSTCSNIIRETCEIIFKKLQPLAIPKLTKEKMVNIADDFDKYWQFPNCIGSIDGKHFEIKAPPNTGTLYYNYKGFFSVVMLATCDSQYKFTTITMGSAGSESDGGIFSRSTLGKKIEHEDYFPPSRIVHEIFESPFVIIGDEAFPLKRHLMRPYPGQLSQLQRVFNYRLSRARRVIENAFGILVARWQILNKTMNLDPQSAIWVINACCVLHNYVKSKATNLYCPPGFLDTEDDVTGDVRPGDWRNGANYLQGLDRQGPNNHARTSENIRQNFVNYFNGTGAVSWQMEQLFNH